MTSEMELVGDASCDVRFVYGEALYLRELGKPGRATASQIGPVSGGPIWGLLMVRCWGLMRAGRRRWRGRGGGWLRGWRSGHDQLRATFSVWAPGISQAA